jgi:hypothetical protein
VCYIDNTAQHPFVLLFLSSLVSSVLVFFLKELLSDHLPVLVEIEMRRRGGEEGQEEEVRFLILDDITIFYTLDTHY